MSRVAAPGPAQPEFADSRCLDEKRPTAPARSPQDRSTARRPRCCSTTIPGSSSRKFRTDVPFHAVIETLLSIHTPIPRAVAFWEAPTRLVMGHGQTAKGMLRFEKDKESVAKTGGLVKVKVSGVLKAEGVVAGNLIKDGTYTVTGEQLYEPSSREWKSARWSVVVDNELANPAGLTIARATGTMLVRSRLFTDSPSTTVEPAINEKPSGSRPRE